MYQLRNDVGPSIGVIMGQVVEPKFTIKQIIQEVADYFGLSVEQMQSKKREKDFVLARHIAMYLTRELTDKSYPQMAAVFERDHTTILHGWRKIYWILNGNPFPGKRQPREYYHPKDEVKFHIDILMERLSG